MKSSDVDVDGPPPPPHVRRRRRQRSVLGVVGVILLGAAVVAVVLARVDPPPPTARDAVGAQEGSDGDAPTSLDLDQLHGIDAVFGRLLLDVDDSERVMVGFQRDVEELVTRPEGDTSALLEEIAATAEDAHDELLEVRMRLEAPREDPRADAVRVSYLQHLDAWAEYLRALGQDPGLLADQARSAPHDVAINATADDFARQLEEQLPDTVADSVRAFADTILDRGFRQGSGVAEV